MKEDRPYNVDFSINPPPGEFSGTDDVKFMLWGWAGIIGLPLSIILLVVHLFGILK